MGAHRDRLDEGRPDGSRVRELPRRRRRWCRGGLRPGDVCPARRAQGALRPDERLPPEPEHRAVGVSRCRIRGRRARPRIHLIGGSWFNGEAPVRRPSCVPCTCEDEVARMSSAAAGLIEVPNLSRRRELLLGAALTAAFAGLVLAIGPAPGDAPVHLYRTFLVRDGALIWDNFWYAGPYPLASYSLLYYLPAALVGNLPLVFAAAVASTVLFSSIALREWGRAALWPSRVFGVLAAAPMFTGLYAYTLGFTAMLATLKLLQVRRLRLAALIAAITVGLSPLAFAFLCLVVVSYVVSRREISRRHIWFGAGLVVAAGIEVLALLLFPGSTGSYPFHWVDFVSVLAVTTLGVLVARRARGAAPLVAFYALWGLGRAVAPRGQLDPAERVHRPRDAAYREPRRLSAAASRRAGARRSVRLQPRAVHAPHPVAARQPVAARELLAARDWIPPGPRPARFSRRGGTDGRALGGVLDPEGRARACARLVPAARRRGQPRPLLEEPRPCRLPELAALERRPLRPPQPDLAARLGRRPAGEERAALGGLRAEGRLPEPELGDLRAA